MSALVAPHLPITADTRAAPRTLWRSVVAALAAAAIRGSWALYINLPAGHPRAFRAALTQVLWSFCATFTVTVVQEAVFRLAKSPRRGFWLSSFAGTAIGIGLGTLVHALAGTPRILATMAPSAAIAPISFTTYAWALRVAAEAKLARG